MSLLRFVYYSAIIGGWSAFLGWLVAELLLGAGDPAQGWLGVVTTCGVVGAAIGAGLNLVAGMANAMWKQQLRRVLAGLISGGLGGLVGGALGELLYSAIGLPRALGWTIMGAAIGLGGGISERSRREVRNGLIGGTLGGLLGGLLFDPMLNAIASGSGMTSRATAFVLLGACIGVLIGLVRVVMKEAWLTVLDGYRAGRQVILGDGVAILGRAEYATLPLLGPGNTAIEWEHVRITRRPDGRYLAEPKPCDLGTKLNFQPMDGPAPLSDGDVLGLGGNLIRYNERRRGEARSDGIEPPRPAAEPAVAAPRPAASPPSRPMVPRPAPPPSPPTRPAPASASKPVPTAPRGTPVTPAESRSPSAAVGGASRSEPTAPAKPRDPNACPRCGRVAAAGQRYCIVCDENY